MLKLSRMTDYGVVVLSALSQDGPTFVTAPELAGTTGLPAPTVAKLLKLLAHGGLVYSQRGATGGYTLARAPVCISAAEIIAAIDGPLALTECVEGSDVHCKVETLCPIRGRWDRVNRAVKRALEEVTLAELAAPFVPPSAVDPAALGALRH